MICPRCYRHKSKVVETEYHETTGRRRRRRECGFCGKRFSTWEVSEKDYQDLSSGVSENVDYPTREEEADFFDSVLGDAYVYEEDESE